MPNDIEILQKQVELLYGILDLMTVSSGIRDHLSDESKMDIDGALAELNTIIYDANTKP